MTGKPIPCVLSIAGSDSGGGAGIQADLKAFARCGVHGMTAITAITVQNTVEVRAVEPVSPDVVVGQVAAVADDLGVDAVKVGMLGSTATIEAVALAIRALPAGTPVVVDPVMVAESGGRLLDVDAERALRELILPLASVVTPNVAEARVLAGVSGHDERATAEETGPSGDGDGGADTGAGTAAELEDVARRIHALGAGAVIVTGGHRAQATDLLFDGDRLTTIPGDRHPGGAAHGSGCTHSSVLAAQLAWGRGLLEAARTARAIAGEAVRDGLRGLGHGPGPVDVLGLAAARRDEPSGGRGFDIIGARR